MMRFNRPFLLRRVLLLAAAPLIAGAVGCAKGNAIDGTGGTGGAPSSTTGSRMTTSTSMSTSTMSTGTSSMHGSTTSTSSSMTTSTGTTMTSSSSGCGTMCDMDKDGVFDADDKCPNTPTGAPVNKEGCSDSQTKPTLNPNFPPWGLTWTPTGDAGHGAAGLTWTYTGIARGDLFHTYWVVCDDPTTPCGMSLDGPIDAAAEGWSFSPTSDLMGGQLIFFNSTTIMLADGTSQPVQGRLTMTIVDDMNMPIPFATLTTLGIIGQTGKFGAEIKGAGYTVTMHVEAQDAMGNWVPYLDYYDAQPTADPGMGVPGSATVSLEGSFYDE